VVQVRQVVGSLGDEEVGKSDGEWRVMGRTARAERESRCREASEGVGGI
jgi:hypothetical protein